MANTDLQVKDILMLDTINKYAALTNETTARKELIRVVVENGVSCDSQTYLISYCDGGPIYEANQFELVESVRRGMGVDKVISYQRQDLEQTFIEHNRDIFSRRRGGGYWLWKPYIILQTLLRYCKPGDTLIYADSGSTVIGKLTPLIQLSKQHGMVLFNNCHPNRGYFKREAMHWMGYRTHEEEQRLLDKQQINGAFLVMQCTQDNIRLVTEWLNYCQDPRILTDDNTPGLLTELDTFIDHRHDQSVLSAVIDSMPNIPKHVLEFEATKKYFNHHRRRLLICWSRCPHKRNAYQTVLSVAIILLPFCMILAICALVEFIRIRYRTTDRSKRV